MRQANEAGIMKQGVAAKPQPIELAYSRAFSHRLTTAAYVCGSIGAGVRGRIPSIAVQTLCIVS